METGFYYLLSRYYDAEIKQIDNAMDIAEKVGDTLLYVAVGIEVCENAYINVEQGESTKKIVWDMTVDAVISEMNTYVSIKAGAAIGTTVQD